MEAARAASLVSRRWTIPISIFEKAKRKEHQPTPEDDKHRWFSIPKYDYFPTGELQIRTADYYPKLLFSETRRRRLEDNLNKVVIHLIRHALQMKQDRLDREERQKEQLAREERRRELLEAIRQEKKRVDDLEVEVENWHKAERIRAYIETVKKNGAQQDPTMEFRALDQWVAWAQQQADRFDPMAENSPSILNEEDELSRRRFE